MLVKELTIMDINRQIDFVNKFYESLKNDTENPLLQHKFNLLSICTKMVYDKGWHHWGLYYVGGRDKPADVILTPFSKPNVFNECGLPHPSKDELSVNRIGWSTVVVTDEPTLCSYTVKVNKIIKKHLKLLENENV